jgi:Cu/Ag efflux pump CusA
MGTDYVKKAIVCGWVIALVAIAIVLNVSTITGWVALIGLGLPPPVVMWRKWKQPATTLSESIRKELR